MAYLFVAVLGLLLMAFIAGLVILMTKGDERAMTFVNAVGTKLRFLHPETLPRFFGQLVARVKQLSTDRRQLAKAVFFASANWLFDAASLFVFLGAFGRWVDPVALLVAYGVANIAAAIPFTPGGLGVLELTLIGILVGFGPPRAIVILGVVAWRLVNFWLPIPVGGISYLSLRVHPPAGSPAGLAERRALWRARWRWVIELFGKETPAPVPAGSPSLIDKVVDSDALPGPPSGDGARMDDAPLVPDAPLGRGRPGRPTAPAFVRLTGLFPRGAAVPCSKPPAPAATLVRTPGPIPPGRSGAIYRAQDTGPIRLRTPTNQRTNSEPTVGTELA